MRIGILTYHRAHNYGAMLQAFALSTFLRGKGHDVFFIDYCSTFLRKEYSLWRRPNYKPFSKDYAIGCLVLMLTFVRRIVRRQKFKAFAGNYLGISGNPKYTEKSGLFDEHIDLCIIGSDQVWRNRESDGRFLGFDDTYFGTSISAQIPCISYAASMGIINLSPEDESYLRTHLPRFRSLLVREESLKECIISLGFAAETVCDPVMLLDKEQWNSLLPEKRYAEKLYVLYYELLESKEALRSASSFARSCGLELQVITARVHPVPRKGVNQTASPIDLVQAIRDAEFVISTSFHGTAFSIIFEKQFYTMGLRNNSDRVVSLLEKLDINGRYVSAVPSKSTDIDYEKVRKLSRSLVERSVELLNKSIYRYG